MPRVNSEKLKVLRVESGKSHEDLAKGLCTPQMLDQIEQGVALPSGKVVQELATRLNVESSVILSE